MSLFEEGVSLVFAISIIIDEFEVWKGIGMGKALRYLISGIWKGVPCCEWTQLLASNTCFSAVSRLPTFLEETVINEQAFCAAIAPMINFVLVLTVDIFINKNVLLTFSAVSSLWRPFRKPFQ